jgi:putative nucleotidyltransferase with HDIG domain
MIGLRYLLKEGATERAALDFLSKMVKESPYKGKVYLAGGAVRDELMGLDLHDIDLVIEFPSGGIEFAKWITKRLNIYSSSNPVIFERFGTAKFNLRGINHNGQDLSDLDIECVMTRQEKYTAGSRKPEVSVGSLKQDVERRDFTVNSMLKDLTTGEILDLTGMGKDDLKKGVIRTPLDPDIIFAEDPLRMLRAIRFTVKYGWTLPLFMIRSIKNNSHLLKDISSERIQAELNKMLVTKSPDTAVRLLQITGLNKNVAPELDLLIGLKQNKYHYWDANKHTLLVLKGTPPNLQTRLAALFHDIGKSTTKSVVDNEVHFYEHEDVGADIAGDIMRRLKYPNDIIDKVTKMIRGHMRLKGAGKEGEVISDKALRKLQAELGEHLEDTLDLMHADNMAHGSADMPNQIPGVRARLKTVTLPNKDIVKLPIDGNDIMKQLNLKPSKIVGQILAVIKDEYFGNPNMTAAEALEIAKNTYDKLK